VQLIGAVRQLSSERMYMPMPPMYRSSMKLSRRPPHDCHLSLPGATSSSERAQMQPRGHQLVRVLCFMLRL
jgi:hypothetical protein